MSNLASFPDPFSPLFKHVDTLTATVRGILPSIRNSQDRQFFTELLKHVTDRQAELAVLGPQAIAKGIARADAFQVKMAELYQQGEDLLSQFDAHGAVLKEELAKIDAQLVVLKAQPIPEPARPRKIPGKKKVEIKLSSGEVLHDLLMARTVVQPPKPRVLGNIWENWPST
ncbi:MAG: hypothetical protein DWH82_10960 [Planctomycetota bacterium]|nr:MAG: hypothetical protein DWH82_10960 [Planctomycetota bacterium]